MTPTMRPYSVLTPAARPQQRSPTQTFDPDAPPLDISTTQHISVSVSKATEAAEAEAKRLKEKEERRQQRKARKEMKRLMGAGVVDGEEFVGFQGSGGLALLKRLSGAGGTTATSSSGSHSRSQSHSHSQSQQSREGFGHFVSAPPSSAEEDVENANLDRSLYTRKKSNSTSGTHSSGGTSDGRRNRSSWSRTSASASDRAHHTPSHQHLPNPGIRKFKSKHSSTSQSRSRSNTSSQLPSLASPSSPAFSVRVSDAQAQIVSPSIVEQGQEFFDLEEDEMPVGHIEGGGFPVGRIGAPGGGFPMTGFGGTGGGKRSRDFGALLARRGDEEGRVGDGGGDGV